MDRPGSSWAFEAALCLLAPFFFLSTIFTILAPLPVLYLHQGFQRRKRARTWAFIALPVGCVISGIVAGPFAAVGFFIYAGLPAVFMGELLERKVKVESTIGLATLLVLLLSLSTGAYFIKRTGNPVLATAKTQILNYVNLLTKELLNKQKDSLSESSRKEIEKIAEDPDLVLNESVGLVIAGILLLCSIPVITLLRWNPKNFQSRVGIRRDFIRRWSSPEWLVWPSLFCFAFLIYDVPYLTLIATNLLKPLILIYFLHGVSILSFYMDLFRVRGPIRAIFYAMALFFLAPMIVSFGFFDLWFKFRDRVRTITTPNA